MFSNEAFNCLMTNHYHLLVETPQANLSRAMKWINVSYAVYFNRKRSRRGHLFQGRFKSILVQTDEYLKQLSRYIHLNPLRVKMVEDLGAYKWSSYPAYIGQAKAPKWLETVFLLGLCGRKRRTALLQYHETAIEAVKNPAKDLVGGFMLGDTAYVDWIKKTFLSACTVGKEIPQLRKLHPRRNIETVIETVCNEYNCNADQILRKGRKKNVARDIAIYLARELTDESGVALGKFFGNITGAGITVRYNHLAGQIAKNRRLRGTVDRIRKRVSSR